MLPGSATLRYRLLQGAADVAPLRILATECFSWRGWSVTAHVLGASHALCLVREGTVLTELFTCAPAPEEPQAILALEGQGCSEARAHGLAFQVRIWHQALGCRLAAPNLTVPFPTGSSGIAPETQLAWDMTHSLRITTIHTYPEENLAVWTETTFTETEP